MPNKLIPIFTNFSDPEPTFCGVAPSQGNPLLRIRNLEIVLKNLRSLYQEEFNQMVIMVPNVVRLGTECNSAAAKNDLNLLLLLLLACAVQCPNKEIFIERIKLLPLDVQHSIVDYIKQVGDFYFSFQINRGLNSLNFSK